jgi:predicted metalloprotease
MQCKCFSARSKSAIAAACSALLLAGCGHIVLDGQASSMLYDPERVGGLPASDGPSGPRGIALPPTGIVRNTDGGSIDRRALLAVNDIEDFWKQHYSDSFRGRFLPVSARVSYDPNSPLNPAVCGDDAGNDDFNALYCPDDDSIYWDRADLLPVAKQYFGDMAINALLAHEYGHAVQLRAKLVDDDTPPLVREQQADCFSGAYLRWVAEGHSPRFTVSTTDGLSKVLAGAIAVRDPITTPEHPTLAIMEHGTALDRITAFQKGFDNGPHGCAAINAAEIEQRRGNLPKRLFNADIHERNVPIDNNSLSTLMALLRQIFSPANPPTLSLTSANCPNGAQPKPAAYCPATNTIAVDLAALQQIGAPGDERHETILLQGDDTAFSIVTSRFTLALQHERGLPMDSLRTAMRTACLTGVAQRKMADPLQLPSGNGLVLGAGDVDKAVAGLLTNGLVASDVNGATVPAGFTRIVAFRSGLVGGDAEQCYQRFS